MKRKIFYILLMGFLLGSCCTEKSAVRYLQNNPDVIEKLEKDTIIVVEQPQVDTTIVVQADTVSLIDTFYVDSTRIIIHKDTVNGQDTIKVYTPPTFIEVEVPVTEYVIKNRVVAIPDWKLALMWMGGLLSVLLLIGLIYFIRLLFK